jgi:uncharacterized protein VirK/YbjX
LKSIPNFDKAGDRLTIFSPQARAKTIIGHYPGRPEVNEKRFEFRSPNDSQLSWTGALPRKLSLNINFGKVTNREGAKLVILKERMASEGCTS